MAYFRIRFITSNDFVSDAIRLVTFAEFSHAEIVTETGSYIGAHDDGGVEERPADYCSPSVERRYAIPCPDDVYAKIMAYARAAVGTTPYDFRDIAGLLFHRDISTKGRAICSEFVFEAARQAGLYLLNVEAGRSNLVTPETLHLSPLLIGHCYYQKGT